jgi:hypothetical protein
VIKNKKTKTKKKTRNKKQETRNKKQKTRNKKLKLFIPEKKTYYFQTTNKNIDMIQSISINFNQFQSI